MWPQSFGGIWDIQFHDLSLGWALRGGSYILRTTNGGDNWTEHELPGFGKYVKFQFADATVGYAAGAYGKVCKTTNGGLSWQLLDTGTGEHLQDLEVVSAQEMWAVGGNNSRIHTTDGGQSWENLPVTGIDLPDFQSWHALDIDEEGIMRVAGNVGIMLREAGPLLGDCDVSGTVDLADVWGFAGCLAGPAVAAPPECVCFDVDDDGSVTLADFAVLQRTYTGP